MSHRLCCKGRLTAPFRFGEQALAIRLPIPRIDARRVKAFTLVELVVTIAILGILSAYAAPRFFDNRVFAERGYADELASALRTAHKVAVASGCPVTVTITATAYQARQRATAATCRTAGAWTTQVSRADGTALNGAAPSSVTSTSATFVFTEAGTLQAASPPIQVGPYSITVVAGSGFVSVQ